MFAQKWYCAQVVIQISSGLLINQTDCCPSSAPFAPMNCVFAAVYEEDWRDEALCMSPCCSFLWRSKPRHPDSEQLVLIPLMQNVFKWGQQCITCLWNKVYVCVSSDYIHVHEHKHALAPCGAVWRVEAVTSFHTDRQRRTGLNWSTSHFISRFCSWTGDIGWMENVDHIFPQSVMCSYCIHISSVRLKWCHWCKCQIRVKPLQKLDEVSPASLLLSWFIRIHSSFIMLTPQS